MIYYRLELINASVLPCRNQGHLLRLLLLLLLPVSFLDFYNASKTLPSLHDLHFRGKTPAISRETLHTGNCDLPCQDFMQKFYFIEIPVTEITAPAKPELHRRSQKLGEKHKEEVRVTGEFNKYVCTR